MLLEVETGVHSRKPGTARSQLKLQRQKKICPCKLGHRCSPAGTPISDSRLSPSGENSLLVLLKEALPPGDQALPLTSSESTMRESGSLLQEVLAAWLLCTGL